MSSCELCGKEFKFPYLLIRHLNRVTSCAPNKLCVESGKAVEKTIENCQDVQENKQFVQENCQDVQEKCQKVHQKEFKCEKCEKVLSCKRNLERHMKTCSGVGSLQCPICKISFNTRQSKCYHMKKNNCSPPAEKVDLEEENRLLKKEILILKATSKGSLTTNNTTNNNNNTTNNINNITNNYIIKYNPETRCITSNDPNAPVPELLCLNGFKHEAAKSKLKDIDRDQLQKHIDNVRLSDNYYALYTFFFRNVDNQRLHMFNMGKSSNSTHAHVFNNGSLEKIHKSTLFESISKYIGQYLLNMSVDNLDVINKVLTDQKSKDAFIEVMRDKSHTFNYYRENDDVMELEE